MTSQINEKSTNELAEDRTSLAAHRTLMAADRTLMAWVRTALSMISFGFTIYKILQTLQDNENFASLNYTPQSVGLFLTGLGTFSMLMGTIEYWQTLKELRLIQHYRILRPSFIIAVIISISGLIMFFSISTRLL